MERVGIKEFKNRANELVREVREHGCEYVITVDGEPVATVRPFQRGDERIIPDAEIEAFLAGWREMAEDIGRVWPHGLSAVEAVRQQRREL